MKKRAREERKATRMQVHHCVENSRPELFLERSEVVELVSGGAGIPVGPDPGSDSTKAIHSSHLHHGAGIWCISAHVERLGALFPLAIPDKTAAKWLWCGVVH